MLLAVGGGVIAADKQSELWTHAVIETKAGRVERGWIREAGEELAGPLAGQILARGWKRVSGKQGCGNSLRLIARIRGGDDVDLGLRLAQAKPLIGNEEESLVAQDRTSEYAAKVVLFFCQARQTFIVVVPGVGVEDVVADVF